MGVSVVFRRVGGRVEVYKRYESDLRVFLSFVFEYIDLVSI